MSQAKTITVALVANQPLTLTLTGTYLRCLDSAAAFTVELGGREKSFGGQIPFSEGRWIRENAGFETVRLVSDSNQSVTLLAIFGDYGDDSLIISTDVSVNTKPSALTMVTGAAVTALAGVATLLANASTGRRYLGVFNEGPEVLYIRENNTAAKSPLVVSPGGFLPVPLSSAVYAYNAGTNDTVVQVAEFS